MKFVHLTPQPKIARVKRSGIRFGSGRRGRGVYAVPLMLMQCVTFTDDDKQIPAEPRSSTTLWQWLSSLNHRHRNLAAVTFSTTADHWPAELYIELKSTIGTDWLTLIDSEAATVTNSDLQFVRNAHKHQFIADLKLSIRDSASLGKVLSVVQAHGLTTWDRYDETVEIIFPNPIAARLITRVTPLYRTSSQFKRDREGQHDAG